MTCAAPGDGVLLERQGELASVAARVEAAGAGEGGVLVVEGPAGIGKTRLLDAARAAAADGGLRVLSARASPLEREFGFGIVRDLLAPVLRDPAERAALMHGAARLAGPALEPGDLAVPGFAALHGIYWLVAEMAERRPLPLAIDDAHWADAASLRALCHLAHRITGLPVLLAVATGEPNPVVTPSSCCRSSRPGPGPPSFARARCPAPQPACCCRACSAAASTAVSPPPARRSARATRCC